MKTLALPLLLVAAAASTSAGHRTVASSSAYVRPYGHARYGRWFPSHQHRYPTRPQHHRPTFVQTYPTSAAAAPTVVATSPVQSAAGVAASSNSRSANGTLSYEHRAQTNTHRALLVAVKWGLSSTRNTHTFLAALFMTLSAEKRHSHDAGCDVTAAFNARARQPQRK